MCVDVKETIKKYFLVRMKVARRDALSLEPIFSLMKILKELQMATCGRCYNLVPHIFLLVILMQNFILINDHIKFLA